MKKLFLFFILTIFCINKGLAVTRTVTSNANAGANTLREALGLSGANDSIEFNITGDATARTITLLSRLPSITDNLTIDGTNAAGTVTVKGAVTIPGFVITNGTVSISKLNIQDCNSKGGNGAIGFLGAGGGGGMGAGGGVYVNSGADVTLSDISFDGCSVTGGDGGAFFIPGTPGGGAGAGGLGGSGAINNADGGGGGGGLYLSASTNSGVGGGGDGGNNTLVTGPTNGSDFGGGGGAGDGTIVSGKGADGGFAGGGGGGVTLDGGDGNFGGGGGGGGGAGGVTNGGSSLNNTGGTGGGGQGSLATAGGGGGGAGFGGAVFLRTGGTLSFNSDITSNQSATVGAGGSSPFPGTSGTADGDGAYLMSSTTLTLNPAASDNKTIAAEISGSGAVTKNGLGTYTLSATNNYTGATAINAGTLIVNGSIAASASTTVAAGATLKGTGTVSVTTVNGIMEPGTSIGTITVSGNYAQNAGSTLSIEIDSAGNASKVNITGSATISNTNTTVEVTAQAGDYSSDLVYTILQAATGRTGEYLTLTVLNPGELDGGTLALAYTSTLVQLIFTADRTTTPTAKSLSFVSNNIMNQANHFQSNMLFEQDLLRYYQSLCPCHKKGARPYFLANYLHGHFKTSTYTQAAPFSLSGGLIGIDYWFKDDLILGAMLDYQRSWTESDDHMIKANSNNYILSIYLQKLWEKFFIQAAVSGSYSDFKTHRFLNRREINNASFDGFNLSAQTSCSRVFKFNNMRLIPSLAVRYFYQQVGSFLEKEKIVNRLDLESQKNHVLEGIIKAHFFNTFFVSFGAIIPQVEASYIPEFLKNKTTFGVKLVSSSIQQRHPVELQINPKNTYRFKTAIDFRFHNCSILNISYAASFATHQRITNEVHLGYRIDF